MGVGGRGMRKKTISFISAKEINDWKFSVHCLASMICREFWWWWFGFPSKICFLYKIYFENLPFKNLKTPLVSAGSPRRSDWAGLVGHGRVPRTKRRRKPSPARFWRGCLRARHPRWDGWSRTLSCAPVAPSKPGRGGAGRGTSSTAAPSGSPRAQQKHGEGRRRQDNLRGRGVVIYNRLESGKFDVKLKKAQLSLLKHCKRFRKHAEQLTLPKERVFNLV